MSDAPAPTAAPNPILGVLGRALEGALNRLLALDPDTQQRMAELDGRAISLDFGTPMPALRLAVDGTRLRVGPASAGISALRVAATPGALLQWALARGRDAALPSGRIEIAGDAALARRLEQIATRFAPDFDAAFVHAFGDVAGFRIARAVREGLAWARTSTSALLQDSADFLSEDGRELVGRAELDGFLDAIDELRERGDRLDTRVQRLRARHGLSAA